MSDVALEISRRATYAAVQSAPEHLVAEILSGNLVTTPRPRLRHALALWRLSNTIGPAFDRGLGGPGGWWILAEPELHLGEDLLVPDIAGWRRERMPEFPDEAYAQLAPDWVCEVLSPSTETIDRGRKLAIYGREGVKYLWFLSPTPRMLEVMVLQEGQWVIRAVHIGDGAVRAEPFEAIDLELGVLWGK